MTRHEAVMELSALVRTLTDAREERERCESVLNTARRDIEQALLGGRDPSPADERTRSEYERLYVKAARAFGAADRELSARGHELRETIRRTPHDDGDAVFARAVDALRERLGEPKPQSPWPSTMHDLSETWEMETIGDDRRGRFYVSVALDERGCYFVASCDHGIGSKRRDTLHTFLSLSKRLTDDIVAGNIGFSAARTAQECEPAGWKTAPLVTTFDTALAEIDSLIQYGNTHAPMRRIARDDQW